MFMNVVTWIANRKAGG